jgi:hypothetical protein
MFLIMFRFSITCIHNLSKKYLSRWCHDIGREQAANKPLLKTVFQVTLLVLSANLQYGFYEVPMVLELDGFVCSQVMMRLFSPRKTTLMFVIRDKTRVCFSPSC